MDQPKVRILVWDLPVRMFHWLLAAGFLASYGIARLLGEHSSAFPFHAMIGLTLAVMVLFRIVWAVVGTRWARFKGLSLDPGDLGEYLGSVTAGRAKEFVGHNPATSAAMLVIFALVLSLGWTGYQKAVGNKGMEDVHGFLANLLLVIAIVHVSGVLLHTFRHRDGIVASMLHGRKLGDPADGIPGPSVLGAVVFLSVVGLFAGSLVNSYDSATGATKWPVVGTPLPLGEGEGGRGGERSEDREHEGEQHEED